jgi:hypothetical protein
VIARAPVGRALVLAICFLSATGCGALPASQGREVRHDFSCRLPVGSFPTGVGGFIDFPSGKFSRDPQSAFSYDSASGRWLAVPRALISPDRASYAASEFSKVSPYGSLIRIVDMASDTERASWRVEGNAGVVGWTPGGVYFIRSASRDPNFLGPELWVLNPTTGERRLVTPQPKPGRGLPLFKAWTALGGGAVWSKTVPDTAPSTDVLVRVDLSDGRAVTWFKAPGLEVLGWDEQGHPFVAFSADVSRPSVRLIRLLGPNQPSSIGLDGFAPAGTMPPSEVTDEHGAWFAAADGSIWLLGPGPQGKLTRVGAVPLPPPVTPQSDVGFELARVLVAGPCS